MSITRREFITHSAAILAGAWASSHTVLGQTTAPVAAPAPDAFAPPGEFKVKYFGRLSELRAGAVLPKGWLKGWIDRQIRRPHRPSRKPGLSG